MPVMDRLAAIGRQGTVDPPAFSEGYGPEQYIWSLLGMGPEPWPHGTGLLEAIGHGLEIDPDGT
jgi:2,3-bisphosphoglycerate-independent phosphoglycerate mutase